MEAAASSAELLFRVARDCERLVSTSWSGEGAAADLSDLATSCDAACRKGLHELLLNSVTAAADLTLPRRVAVVYDVEGTTTPLPFVTKVLYPYSAERIDWFVAKYFTRAVLADVAVPLTPPTRAQAEAATPRRSQQLQSLHGLSQESLPDDELEGPPGALQHSAQRRRPQPPAQPPVATAATDAEHRIMASLVRRIADAHGIVITASSNTATVGAQIARALKSEIAANSKAAHLKEIQGRIWRTGYDDGSIKGHLFGDAVRTIRQLAGAPFSEGVSQHIYSSGSVQAQQLLFRHSSGGDLTPCLTGYYDPSIVGPKLEAPSYVNLTNAIARRAAAVNEDCGNCNQPTPPAVVFVTDSLAEIKAARASNVACVLCVRPCNLPLPATLAQFEEAIGGASAASGIAVVTSLDLFVDTLGRVTGLQTDPIATKVLCMQAETGPYAVEQEGRPSAAQLKTF